LRHRHAIGRAPLGSVSLPHAWERFDVVLRQRDYFMKGAQALFDFMRQPVLRPRERTRRI
jgi:hypothetical protein